MHRSKWRRRLWSDGCCHTVSEQDQIKQCGHPCSTGTAAEFSVFQHGKFARAGMEFTRNAVPESLRFRTMPGNGMDTVRAAAAVRWWHHLRSSECDSDRTSEDLDIYSVRKRKRSVALTHY